MMLENGKLVEAREEPYYPNLMERFLHIFGIHQWTYSWPKKCVMCGKPNKKNFLTTPKVKEGKV